MAKNPRLIDMRSRQCGDWYVLGQWGNAANGRALWLCRCVCGVERPVSGGDLRSGKSQNCGCKKVERAGALRRTHGKSRTRLHNIWKLMHARCKDETDPIYGGRGIAVCCEWSDFQAFHDWAHANGYAPNLSIDRRNNDEGYSPDNCRWADNKEQSRNRRFVARTSDGRRGPDVAEENGIPIRTYNVRRSAGWTVDEAATTPHGQLRKPRRKDELGRFC